MNDLSNKHEHYELLNLLGYGLAKFNNDFIKQFNCRTKEQFYQYFVDFGIAKTKSVVKIAKIYLTLILIMVDWAGGRKGSL